MAQAQPEPSAWGQSLAYPSYGAYPGYPYAAYNYSGYPQGAWGSQAPAAAPAPPPDDAPPPLPPEEGPPGAPPEVPTQAVPGAPGTAPAVPTQAPSQAPPAPLAPSTQEYSQYYASYYQAYGAAYSQDPAHQGYAQAQAYPSSHVGQGAYPAQYSYPSTAQAQSAYAVQSATEQNKGVSASATANGAGPRPPYGEPPSSARQNSLPSSYNTMPPPASLTGANSVPVNNYRNQGYQQSIRPTQLAHQSPAAKAAAVAQSFHQQHQQAMQQQQQQGRPTPAYIRAGTSSAANPAAKPAGKPAGGAPFPPSFNSWVERCFSSCRSDVERQSMTGLLTEKIKTTQAEDRMWLVDWDREPIPNIAAGGSQGAGSGENKLGSPTSQGGGLRSKRNRWEESEEQAQTQQQTWEQYKQQKQVVSGAWVGPKNKQQKQQGKNKKQKFGAELSPPAWVRGDGSRLAARADRFGVNSTRGGPGGSAGSGGTSSDDDYDAWDAARGAAVVGTSTALEKSYFRLTGPPDPREVRPPAVLRRALDRLVRMLREGDARATPFYAVDQFKGLRQDCTVQHMRDALTVEVYEAHARQSLEYGDLAEFNQCQTQLAGLYAEGVPGCQEEFNAYKLLYNVAHARSGANKALLHSLRVALAQRPTGSLAPTAAAAAAAAIAAKPDPDTPAIKSEPGSTETATPTTATAKQGQQNITQPDPLSNALAAREAFASGNYPGFFRAYAAAPNMGRAILDVLAPLVRWSALNVLVKSYKTNLPLSFVARALGFVVTGVAKQQGGSGPVVVKREDGEVGEVNVVRMAGCRSPVYVGKAAACATEEEGVAACAAWLRAHGATVEEAADGTLSLDVKASMGHLFVPEETSKVAHGDENLSVEDFLARASGLKA